MPPSRRASRARTTVPEGALLAGRYRLGDELGRGGMGQVRAATDVRLGRDVAVKLLRPDLAEQHEVRRRFEREAKAAAALAHPNVVAVFDAGDDGAPYIVMERLPGRTLADEIAAGPISPDEAREVARQVLAALEAAHAAGIVHRDVKPGNVLLARDRRWKVADFGIAKSAEAAGDLTATGVMIGTPAYLAPERIDGNPATPASDVYAVGVLLYESLTGRKPFAAETPIALAELIRAGKTTSLRELCPDLDPAFRRAIERAMSVEPRGRFESAAQMRKVLERGAEPLSTATAGHGTHAEGVRTSTTRRLPTVLRPPRRAGRLPRRGLAFVAGALAVVLLVAVLVSQRDSGTRSPGPSVPSSAAPPASASGRTSGTLPKGLGSALDQLEKAVKR